MNNRGYQDNFLNSMPQGTRWLLIINIAVFILLLIQPLQNYISLFFRLNGVYSAYGQLGYVDLLQSPNVLHQALGFGWIWQTTSYMFLHANSGHFFIFHIFFNMLNLFFLGRQFESAWGTKLFLKFYFFCGVGAGFIILILQAIGASPSYPTVGASGAIFGLILAFCLYYPEREVLVLVFPVKVKYFVGVMFLFSLMGVLVPSEGSRISHAGHLGGILMGILFIRLHRSNYHFRNADDTLVNFTHWLFGGFGYRPRTKRTPKSGSSFKNLFRFGKDAGPRYVEKLDEKSMTDREIEAKIDELLDKISDKGLRGLTVEEQLFLDRVSKLYRHKFPD